MPASIRPLVAIVGLAALTASVTPAAAQEPAARTFIARSPDQAPRALEPTVLRERRVDLDALALGGPATAPADRLRLDLFPDVSYVAIRDRTVRSNAGLVWHGRLDGLPLSTAVFAATDGAFAGHVSSPLGEFSLRQDPGGYVIQQVSNPPGGRPDDAVPVPPDVTRDPAVPPDPALDRRPARAAGAVIDLLVVYSTAAKDEAGGAAPLEAAVMTAVGLLDTTLRAAGTGGARLAGLREVGHASSGSALDSLQQLQNGADGVLDEVLAWRESFSADIVTLVTDFSDPQSCGMGYLSAGFTDYALNVVQGITCLGLGLAHQVGHNLSLHHDWYVTADGGLRPASKGYVSLDGRFRTIMAYPDHCTAVGVSCPRIAAFSNPGSPHQGFPTGVAAGTSTACTAGNVNNPPCDADAASTLVESAPIVAAYKVGNRLDGGRALGPGQSTSAPAAACRLVYQSDGNLVAYNDGTPYYASGTAGTTAGSLVMQTDGNLVIYDAAGTPVWATGTSGNPGAYVVVQDDCNVVLYAADGAPLWATGTP